MLWLAMAAAAFVLVHLLVSGTRLRDALVGRVGEGAYTGAFSIASLALIVALGMAYGSARAENVVWWGAADWSRPLSWAVQLVAFLLIVPGLLTANPASVKQEGALDKPDPARGVLRITRHPFLWGVAIWGVGHLLVNGDLAGLLLFGSLMALSVLGTSSIDAKRLRALGDKYRAFMDVTSNVPFAAILAGRQRLVLGEIGWRLLVALLVYAAVFWGHPWFAGVPVTA